jgi:hypothetical protein
MTHRADDVGAFDPARATRRVAPTTPEHAESGEGRA